MRKCYQPKNHIQIQHDIINAYKNLIMSKQNTSIIKMDITKTKDKTKEGYNFRLRKTMNAIRTKYQPEVFDWLYVVEVPEALSKNSWTNPFNLAELSLHTFSTMSYHAHIVFRTDLSEIKLIREFTSHFPELKTSHIYSLGKTMKNPDVFVENISNRADLANYFNYLIKQKSLENVSYNYKLN